jgi:hypothetical protein
MKTLDEIFSKRKSLDEIFSQPQFSDEAKAQVQANNQAYALRQEENRPWFDKNPAGRLGVAITQGILNSALNPAGYVARAAGMDTKPLKPQNGIERGAELAGEYGFDTAALGGLGKIAQGAGYLGKGKGVASKVAQEVLAPENTTALLSRFVAPAVGGGLVEGITDPRNPFERTLANITGAGIVGGIEGGLRKTVTPTKGGLKNALANDEANAALSKGIKADKTKGVARQINKDAPAVYNELNAEMSQALDDVTGRKLNIDRALDTQQQRYNDFISKNADVEVYSPKSAQGNFANSDAVKEAQLGLINRTNPMFDDYHTGIRKTSDIKTWKEAIQDDESFMWGDFSQKQAEDALKKGKITVYSSHPIEDGGFLSTSKNQARDYAGGGKIYEKEVPLEDVAWINGDEGQYAPIGNIKDSIKDNIPSLKNFTQGLNEFQENALNQALNKGATMSTNAKGSLGATHRAQEVLNDMIDASYDTSVIGQRRPTTETRQLMTVKERLNQILEPSGVKPYDAGISKAKGLRANFEKGYNFKPSETKFENLGLDNLRDKRAFLQGRLAKLQDNVLSDGGTNLATAIKKDENTLRKLMPKSKFETLMNKANSIEESFKRLKSIEGQADREILKEIERNGSSWRENMDAKQYSMLGRAADILQGKLNRKSRSNLANAYLNPETQFITRRGGLLGMLKGSTAADTRQLMIDLLNGGN